LGGIRRSDFFFVMGTNLRGFFWVAWEGEVCLFPKVGRWGSFCFLRNYFFGGVGWVGWRKGVGIFLLFIFFFHNIVI
jgi:hypothetical protein